MLGQSRRSPNRKSINLFNFPLSRPNSFESMWADFVLFNSISYWKLWSTYHFFVLNTRTFFAFFFRNTALKHSREHIHCCYIFVFTFHSEFCRICFFTPFLSPSAFRKRCARDLFQTAIALGEVLIRESITNFDSKKKAVEKFKKNLKWENKLITHRFFNATELKCGASCPAI